MQSILKETKVDVNNTTSKQTKLFIASHKISTIVKYKRQGANFKLTNFESSTFLTLKNWN